MHGFHVDQHFQNFTSVALHIRQNDSGTKASFFANCRVELRTQEAERGMNSEEAERLVWAAQEIFANGCERSSRPSILLKI